MYRTYTDLKEKGLTYANADDITKGIHFLQRITKLQAQAKEFGIDFKEFRAKQFNSRKEGDYSTYIDGSTLIAMVRRGFLTKIAQKTEKVMIPSDVLKFKNKDTGEIVEHWYKRYNFDYTNFEDITEKREITSYYNVYSLVEEQIDLTKECIINVIQAL